MRLVAIVLAVAAVLAGVLATTPGLTRGQEPPPTPRGRLGGPVPLELTPAVPSPSNPTPSPTPASPTPSPTTPPPTTTPEVGTPDSTPTGAGVDRSVEEVVEMVRPALVTVVAGRPGGLLGTPTTEVTATGSGFFLDGGGHVVTAASVVGNGDAVSVILADGERRTARVVGADPLTDLAVLRVEGTAPAPLPLGDTTQLRPGQTVLAFGTPFGELPQTVSQGIVSGVGRTVPDGPLATGLVQLDAPTFPGAAGGPLVSLDGEVVGVQVMAISVNRGERSGLPGIERPDLPVFPREERATTGLSFATPAGTMDRVTKALIADGRVTYPFFGASLQPVTPAVAVERTLPSAAGALVLEVNADGPAARAGIEPGDVILALDGTSITSDHSFNALLFAHRPGDAVEATLRRGEDEMRVVVTLGDRPRE